MILYKVTLHIVAVGTDEKIAKAYGAAIQRGAREVAEKNGLGGMCDFSLEEVEATPHDGTDAGKGAN